MSAFLIYLSTVFGLPHELIMLGFVAALFQKRKDVAHWIENIREKGILKLKLSRSIWLILGIAIFTSLNQWIHTTEWSLKELIPYGALLLITVLTAILWTKIDLKIFYGLVLIEAVVVILEVGMGQSSIFPDHNKFMVFNEQMSLYQMRVMGLSKSSSIVGSKMLLAILILPGLSLKKWLTAVSLFFIIIAIYFSFNRSVFLSVGILCLALFLKELIRTIPDPKRIRIMLIMFALGIIGGTIALFSEIGSSLVNQLTRGKLSIEMSGRSGIWEQAMEFIIQNPILGNGSHDWYFGIYHAHNSYLQYASSHGLLMLLLLLLAVGFGLNKRNIIPVLVISVFSFFQFGFGYSISLLDIVFWGFILNPLFSKSDIGTFESSMKQA